jgi:hypothetical protein
MSSKVAHVIIVGLSEEERQEVDKKALEILRFVDANWQYHSHRCDTIDNAFELAEEFRMSISSISAVEIPRSPSQPNMTTYSGCMLASGDQSRRWSLIPTETAYATNFPKRASGSSWACHDIAGLNCGRGRQCDRESGR